VDRGQSDRVDGSGRPESGVPLDLQMSETRILIRLLRIYFPQISEFGSASEFRWGGLNPQTAPRYATGIHNILSTAPQLSISQKALGTLPEDGNEMPKHVGATIHNQLNEYLAYLLAFHAYFYWGF
jgi:hypothetical protein